MKRILILLFVFLITSCVARCGPISFMKHQIQDHPIRTRIIATAVAGAIYAEGLHQCRIPNVENCQEHYGSAWAGYGSTMALDVVAQGVGYALGGKVGNSISYGANLGVIGWGAYQWNGGLNKPREDEDWTRDRWNAIRATILNSIQNTR